MKRTLALASAVVCALLVSASLHVYTRGRDAMTASDAAMAKGDVRAAVAQAKEAAESRLPFSPWSAKGLERLSFIAEDAEAKGDLESATMALRALQAACTATTIGSPAPCAAQARQALERIAARSGIAEVPGEEPTSPPIWLPLAVMLFAIAAVIVAGRKSAPSRS